VILVLAVPFLVLFGGLFLLVLTHTSSVHQGAAVNTNTGGGWWGAFKRALIVTNPIAVAIGTALDKVFHSARAWVSHWALANLKPVARWFDGLNELHKRTYAQMSGLATDTAHSLNTMRHVVIPHAVQVGVAPVRRQARAAAQHAETAIARERALRSTVTAQHRAQVKLNVHYTHAIDSALPWALPRTRTRVGTLEREYDGLKQRTKALEDGAIDTFKWISAHRTSAAMGVFAGAVAWALSHLGYGFLRCQSWRNFGRQIKCSDANVLRDLLIGATAIALSTDLVALAKAEQAVVGELSTVVRDFWRV
jgi:hypothetical protein